MKKLIFIISILCFCINAEASNSAWQTCLDKAMNSNSTRAKVREDLFENSEYDGYLAKYLAELRDLKTPLYKTNAKGQKVMNNETISDDNGNPRLPIYYLLGILMTDLCGSETEFNALMQEGLQWEEDQNKEKGVPCDKNNSSGPRCVKLEVAIDEELVSLYFKPSDVVSRMPHNIAIVATKNPDLNPGDFLPHNHQSGNFFHPNCSDHKITNGIQNPNVIHYAAGAAFDHIRAAYANVYKTFLDFGDSDSRLFPGLLLMRDTDNDESIVVFSQFSGLEKFEEFVKAVSKLDKDDWCEDLVFYAVAIPYKKQGERYFWNYNDHGFWYDIFRGVWPKYTPLPQKISETNKPNGLVIISEGKTIKNINYKK
ncbi:MAG: hypothetical protein IKN73_01935 [Alphaproteobacteria bacterium]|nr:hypothetical protein [Alphaproteobacteria bacterium]